MKTNLLLALKPFLAMWLLLLNGNVHAQCTITNTSGTAQLSNRTCSGQSFTPTCSGDLSSVTYIQGIPNEVPDRVDVYEGNGLSGTLLYSNTAAVFSGTTHTLTSAVPLTSGIVYTVLFIRTGKTTPCNHRYNAANSYAGGSLWVYTGQYGSGAWTNFGSSDLRFIFTLVSSLPVELTNFKADKQGHAVRLNWRTASERNNKGFEVQRSNDARNWQPLRFVPGNGTTAEAHDYSFLDEKPQPGVNYYRLKQTDFDGHFEYSPVVSVEVKGDGGSLAFFPNPAKQGMTSLFLSHAPEAEAILEIFDYTGQQVFYHKLEPEDGGQSVLMDLSNHPPGIYIARLELGNEVWTERLAVQ